MKVLQNFQKFRVWWPGLTELTEVPGTGNARVNAHPIWGELGLKQRISSYLHDMFSLGQCPRGNLPCSFKAIMDNGQKKITERGDIS